MGFYIAEKQPQGIVSTQTINFIEVTRDIATVNLLQAKRIG